MLHATPTGAHVWKDFRGPAQPVSESFKEIADAGHITAAFRMHNTANPDDHDRIYFFLVLQTSYAVITLEIQTTKAFLHIYFH